MEPTQRSPGAVRQAVPCLPCDRCGAFAPLTERAGNRYCADCLARLRHTIELGEITVGSVLGGAWILARAVGGRVLLVTALLQLPMVAAHVAWSENQISLDLIALFWDVLVTSTVLTLAWAVVDPEQSPGILEALGRSVRLWASTSWAKILARIAWFLGLLFLIVPGVVLGLSFSLAVPVVLFERRLGIEALGISYDRMQGHRWVALGAYLVATLPAFVVAFAVLMVAGIVEVARHGAHHASLSHSPLLALALLTFHVLWTAVALVTASLYAKTRPEVRPPSAPAAGTGDDEVTELTPEELDALTGPFPTGD